MPEDPRLHGNDFNRGEVAAMAYNIELSDAYAVAKGAPYDPRASGAAYVRSFNANFVIAHRMFCGSGMYVCDL
jgi:hypothetical protein